MKRISLFILALIIVWIGLQAQPRITGGFPINITEAPWQVLISVDGELDWCGGSIIAPNFILTAKHCVGGISTSSVVEVIAGVTCKNEINSSNTFNVSQIILHPDPTVDAALLQLSNNITYDNNRQAVNYLSSVDNTLYNAGNAVRVSGWGWLTPVGFDPANCLHEVDVNIITNQQASNMLGVTLRAHEVATTGVGNERQGVCHCDSGGPLTILTNSNEPVLIGIVSWGRNWCPGDNTNSPSVFVRVSHIRNWIQFATCTTPIVNLTGPVTATTTIPSCGDINVANVTVTNNAKLTLKALGEIIFTGDLDLASGTELEIIEWE